MGTPAAGGLRYPGDGPVQPADAGDNLVHENWRNFAGFREQGGSEACRKGTRIRASGGTHGSSAVTNPILGWWTHSQDRAKWRIRIERPGTGTWYDLVQKDFGRIELAPGVHDIVLRPVGVHRVPRRRGFHSGPVGLDFLIGGLPRGGEEGQVGQQVVETLPRTRLGKLPRKLLDLATAKFLVAKVVGQPQVGRRPRASNSGSSAPAAAMQLTITLTCPGNCSGSQWSWWAWSVWSS